MKVKKADTNQPKLFEQIRRMGWSVVSTHIIGKGVPDAVIGAKGRNYWIEIKDPNRPPSQRKLTPDEERFHAEWKGQVAIVETIEDVINLIQLT